MKKITAAVLVSLTCLTILLPVVGSCNHSNIIPASNPVLYQADGWPMPPPIPPYSLATGGTERLLVADGWPMPPPIPPYNLGASGSSDPLLVADGWPMPPPIPPYEVSALA
jgi:hypothetical protein